MEKYSFEISLSILNHLGRKLYRNFTTVLGEAISNSWDADAENVKIFINKEEDSFLILDDGDGMTSEDFQNKFLKIGYSKRKENNHSINGRPFIGRKGIGKLALLSCAGKIHIVSKVKGGEYVGGIIDNLGLDEAITNDMSASEYNLGDVDITLFSQYLQNHDKGTAIYFEGVNEGIRNRLKYLRKIIALYFRFSLIDKNFNIFVNDSKVTHQDINELAKNTEFVWVFNEYEDPFVDRELSSLKEAVRKIDYDKNVSGFIASVRKPSNLNVRGTDEKVTIDLFVNGRLRDRDILKHNPTTRITQSYFYGQIHFNDMDDEVDRFTSSREGIILSDGKYIDFLKSFRIKVLEIFNEWDKLRVKNRKEGDSENQRIPQQDRASLNLFNIVADEYSLPPKAGNKEKIDEWIDGFADDATFNFSSYAECFISENLIRKFIEVENITLSDEANEEIERWKNAEDASTNRGNISIQIRKSLSDLSFLSMNGLAFLVDKRDPLKEASLGRDAYEYKPMRDAIAHTALLTDEAKLKLTTVYSNIKSRVKKLLQK